MVLRINIPGLEDAPPGDQDIEAPAEQVGEFSDEKELPPLPAPVPPPFEEERSAFTGEEFQVAGAGSAIAKAMAKAAQAARPTIEPDPDTLARHKRIAQELQIRTGDDLPLKAGSINFKYLDSPDKVNEVIDIVSREFEPEITAQRRGKRSVEMRTEAARAKARTRLEALKKRYVDMRMKRKRKARPGQPTVSDECKNNPLCAK